MSNFFSNNNNTNETNEIVKVLLHKNYKQLESCGDTNNILIDKINKTFWICNDQCMKNNRNIIESIHKQKIVEINLKDIQSWEN